jgi:ribosome-associated toxin RatA of RatAB toxin-antitoxin module
MKVLGEYRLDQKSISIIESGKVVSVNLPLGPEGKGGYHIGGFTVARNVTPEQIHKIMLDYPKFTEFMPHLVGCEVKGQSGNNYTVKYRVSTPVKNVGYYLVNEHVIGKSIKFKMLNDAAHPHDLQHIDGRWRFIASGADTLINYEVTTVSGSFIPAVIERTFVKSGVPDLLNALRKRARKIYGK